jgi:hypothetical protein
VSYAYLRQITWLWLPSPWLAWLAKIEGDPLQIDHSAAFCNATSLKTFLDGH